MAQRKFIRSGENNEGLPVRLILCFDGTGDTAKGSYNFLKGTTSGGSDSIYAIHSLVEVGPVEDRSGNKLCQYTEYFEGIGTERKQTDFVGTVNGYGFLDILRNAYKGCCEILQQGKKDEIFIFGFSRGAFISRALASFLQYVGLINPEHLRDDENFTKLFSELVAKYGKIKGTKIDPKGDASKGLMSYCRPSPRVRFIGAFDTVKGKFFNNSDDVDFEMDAPHIVDNFRHALALNEDRFAFVPDLWNSAANPGSSYEQAWFFGHHHDIGGGSAQQGLALYPLEWILQSAKEYGLVLNSDIDQTLISILSGTPKTIDISSHKLPMKMTDMLKHHRPNTPWALRLNRPFDRLPPIDRKFWSSVNKKLSDTDPYQLKTFIHPSAYLIFDTSSSFRIQLQGWEGLRKFIAARDTTLKQDVPWWEQWAIERIGEEVSVEKCLSVLVYGKPQTGNIDLISRVFGNCYSGDGLSRRHLREGLAEDHQINTPLSIPDNDQVRIYYSDGFKAGGRDTKDNVERFLAQCKVMPNGEPGKRLHAVWFFVDCEKRGLDLLDKEFLNMGFGDIPIHIILGNDVQLDDKLLKELTINPATEYEATAGSEISVGVSKVRRIVQAKTPEETLSILSRETFAAIDSPAVRNALIKAQRVLVTPKIALAIEESIRAYRIWYSFKFEHKGIRFDRNKSENLSLPLMLMEPVLATFNVRFPSDDILIRSKIGGRWAGLEGHKMGLHDAAMPGGLILMCMIDTIIVIIRALSHQKVGGKTRQLVDPVQPLQRTDIDDACKWYTSPKDNRQAAMHKSIESMLSKDDWSPKGRSILDLQMKLIEVVELESEKAVKDTMSILYRFLKEII